MTEASEKNSKNTPDLPPVRVLLVDNDKDHVRAMHESVQRIGLDCTSASSGPEGAKLLEQNTYDVVVTDLMMNDVDGMDILKKAKDLQPECEVILVTGHATVPRAVEAMRERAFNFLEKPITPKRLQAVVSKAADSIRLKQQNSMLHSRLDERFGFENLIYASESMEGVVNRLRRIAPTDAGVLITGETGAGKDVVAQAIHQNSPRKKKPFVASRANCLVTSKARSLMQSRTGSANSNTPMVVRCSWTKSVTCRCRPKSSCCES